MISFLRKVVRRKGNSIPIRVQRVLRSAFISATILSKDPFEETASRNVVMFLRDRQDLKVVLDSFFSFKNKGNIKE